eukprot:13365346-Alexandrium_andersonii.AAC.1
MIRSSGRCVAVVGAFAQRWELSGSARKCEQALHSAWRCLKPPRAAERRAPRPKGVGNCRGFARKCEQALDSARRCLKPPGA